MAIRRFRTIARISSWRSTLRTSATPRRSIRARWRPPSESAPSGGRRASPNRSLRATRDGMRASVARVRRSFNRQSPRCWRSLPPSWGFRRARSEPDQSIGRTTNMPKREVTSDSIRRPIGVFSQATVVEAKGRLVFISGMTARRPDGSIAGIGDITAQTRQVCENIKAAVESAGGTLDDVCRVDVYVRNIEHFEAIHKVRREYFKPPLPASTMVEVTKMVSPDYLIEINAIAVVSE